MDADHEAEKNTTFAVTADMARQYKVHRRKRPALELSSKMHEISDAPNLIFLQIISNYFID